jgi:hypothetical protein
LRAVRHFRALPACSSPTRRSCARRACLSAAAANKPRNLAPPAPARDGRHDAEGARDTGARRDLRPLQGAAPGQALRASAKRNRPEGRHKFVLRRSTAGKNLQRNIQIDITIAAFEEALRPTTEDQLEDGPVFALRFDGRRSGAGLSPAASPHRQRRAIIPEAAERAGAGGVSTFVD